VRKINYETSGKVQKALREKVFFDKLSVNPTTQSSKNSIGSVFETTDGSFIVESLLVSPTEDVAEAEGIVTQIEKSTWRWTVAGLGCND